jgi:hypothetical protein
LIDSPPLKSEDRRQTQGCVGESPSWLRHWILIPAFEGSNPSSPAIHQGSKKLHTSRQHKTEKSGFGGLKFLTTAI